MFSRYRITAVVHLQGKANIEMTTSKFNTPLLVAVNNGQTPLIELLVNKGIHKHLALLVVCMYILL